VAPNRGTFTQIIDLYATLQLPEQLLVHFNAMKARKIPVSLITFTSIVNMYVAMGQPHRALPIFEEMKSRGMADIIVYNLWIEIYVSKKDHLKVMDLFEEMKTTGVTADVTTYNLIIDVCGQRQERRRVEELWDEMKASRLFPDTLTYTALIAMYATLDPQQAMDTLAEMQALNIPAIPRTFNVLIEMYSKLRLPGKVNVLFKEMKEVGVLPDVITYAHLINLERKLFRKENGLAYFQEMKDMGIVPNQRVLDLVTALEWTEQSDLPKEEEEEPMVNFGITNPTI